jgi:hypothetical protein
MTTQIAARAYTLAEIDEMREHIRVAMRSVFSMPKPEEVETRLRTAMMGGVGVEECKEAAKANMTKITKEHAEIETQRKERHGPSRVTFKAGPGQPSVMEVISDEELATRRAAFNASLERAQKRD